MDVPDFSQQVSHKPFGAGFTTTSKYKRQSCKNFMALGKCKYGHNCNFAHSSKDRRRNEVLGKNQNVVNESMHKRGTCRFFLTDRRCPFGSNCVFKHQGFAKSEDNRDNMLWERYAIDIQTGDLDVKTNPWLKRKLCRSWMMHNRCSYGAKCTFAHGKAELVQSPHSTGSEFGNSVTTLRTEKKDDLPYNAGNQTVEHEVPEKICLLKWKTMKKIVGIYADWIDED